MSVMRRRSIGVTSCAGPGAQNAVLSFPSELCYVLRSVQIMRGMAQGMGVDYRFVGALF